MSHLCIDKACPVPEYIHIPILEQAFIEHLLYARDKKDKQGVVFVLKELAYKPQG